MLTRHILGAAARRHIQKGSLRGSIECQSQPSTETPTELGFIYREREKAGTTGRDTATIEKNKDVQGSVPAAGLSAHLTISQDQTSGSQLSQEKLAALSKPLDEADIAPGHRKAAGLDTIAARPTRSNSPGLRDPSRRRRRRSPEIVCIPANRSSDSSSIRKELIGSAVSISNDNVEEKSHLETWVSEITFNHPHRNSRGTLQESSRANNLNISTHASSPEQNYSMEDLLSRLKSLERENHEVRNGTAEETSHTAPPGEPSTT
ncbi:hypothetical protein HO133_002359 [Letharia lupina]|uniref:Uncharacterized protein n=1 Tax=Letharia lupina TaxID=560253 RepID=A0A8H6CDF4_9LECA|nr:uncharacterized protein HO133_002359 [Letharia lupina]KAF6221503.1 hypothetical protein HO133_002359 [Letharia lupina]